MCIRDSYNPGQYLGRVEYSADKYNFHQEVGWQAYNTAYYAVAEGRGHTLQVTPGTVIDPDLFETWQKKFIESSWSESKSRGRQLAEGINKEDYPENVWRWLYVRMLSAENMRLLVGDTTTHAG